MELYTLLRRAVKRGVLLKTRRVIDLNFNQNPSPSTAKRPDVGVAARLVGLALW